MNLTPIKAMLKAILGPYYEVIKDYILFPMYDVIADLWTPDENLFIPYLIMSILISYPVYRTQIAAGESGSLRHFLRFLIPARIYKHKSAILDYKFYIVNSYVSKILFGWILIGSSNLIGSSINSTLNHVLGKPGPQWQPTATSRIVYTLLIVVIFDLGAYLAHYLEHRIQVLWEFHKTHHSAEVLTPITTFRNHPVDEVLENIFISVFVGSLTAVFSYLYPSGIEQYKIINVSVLMFLYFFVANLLHSHVWLSYGWVLNHIFYSPCMHQIHHSSEQRHFDCNFGRVFSVWDKIFGTLYVPREKEELRYGISNNEHLAFTSVWSCYFVPFKKAFAHLKPQSSELNTTVINDSKDVL